MVESLSVGDGESPSGGLMTENKTRSAVIGVDVGGTKIHAVGMNALAGVSHDVLFSHQVPTQRGVPGAFFDRLAGVIRAAVNEGRGCGVTLDSHIGIGMPGRYVADSRGGRVIAPGTAPNLGVSPHDFDGVDPSHELKRRLPDYSFSVHNDAVAQMRYALELLLRDGKTSPLVRGKRVCYLGPGTGLGGGFAEVSPDGQVESRTDGHVFDIVVEPLGVNLTVHADGRQVDLHRLGTAEELVSGKAIAAMMSEVDGALVQSGANPFFSPFGDPGGRLLDRFLSGELGGEAQRGAALQIARFEGRMLGRIMEMIYRGDIPKADPTAFWPEDDKCFVRGITTFILGGSVPRGSVGDIFRAEALAQLAERVPGTAFSLLFPPAESGHAGALGAALLAGNFSIQ